MICPAEIVFWKNVPVTRHNKCTERLEPKPSPKLEIVMTKNPSAVQMPYIPPI
jgi:hypothetical protein